MSKLHKPQLNLQPNAVIVIENFLSAKECESLLRRLGTLIWGSSRVVETHRARELNVVNKKIRSSETVHEDAFDGFLKRTLRIIERRLTLRFTMVADNLENWQATRYGTSEQFDYHLDCGGTYHSELARRVHTFLIYLESPVRGGATHFRALDQRIEPNAGRLVAWNNLLPDGNCNHAMVHSSLPVRRGRKTTLVTWERLASTN